MSDAEIKEVLRNARPQDRLSLRLWFGAGRVTFRERVVLELRYGCGNEDCYSLNDTAGICKTTLGRVRSIEGKGIRKLANTPRFAAQ